ncbi:MAG: hypothetical protein QM579_11440, partial [Desulfovibrio sp.]|uniref:hypothetical protein n=1 Tax=Desulfovibrio sp. TaxID=885 RepID=UPI0039E63DC0
SLMIRLPVWVLVHRGLMHKAVVTGRNLFDQANVSALLFNVSSFYWACYYLALTLSAQATLRTAKDKETPLAASQDGQEA